MNRRYNEDLDAADAAVTTTERLRQEALRRAQQMRCWEEGGYDAEYNYNSASPPPPVAELNESNFPEHYFSFSHAPAPAPAHLSLNSPLAGLGPSSAAGHRDWPSSSSSAANNSATTTATVATPPHSFHRNNNNNKSDNNLAEQARKEWRQHGTNTSQALEELRYRHGHEVVVRIVAAETRVDTTGAAFTAYRIQLETPVAGKTPTAAATAAALLASLNHNPAAPSAQISTVERRYSDFDKLHSQLLQSSLRNLYKSQVLSPAPFPVKHWAGRLGNWTPSRVWAPAQYEALIELRQAQLDAWLVHCVAHLYAISQELMEFLQDCSTTPAYSTTSSDRQCQTSRKPYQQRNDYRLAQESWSRWTNPVTFTLGSSIRQAVRTLQLMTCTTTSNSNKNNSIPLDLLQAAAGLVFLTVAKAGCVVSGRLGTGLIVARLNNPNNSTTTTAATSNSDTGQTLAPRDNSNNTTAATPSSCWSAPVALGTVGLGWGAQIGGDVTHYLVVLTSPTAVADFTKSEVHLGAELDVAVGPVGRSASQAWHVASSLSSTEKLHPAYAYAHSQGFFCGISLEGSVIRVRHDVTAKFYNHKTTPDELLTTPGRPHVTAAEPLYEALDQALRMEIPRHAFRPSQLLSLPSAAP